MQEQKYTLKEPECFNLKDIFTCGQCFRWKENEEKGYTGVVGKNVIKIKQDGKDYILESKGEDNLEKLAIEYFDLKRDYKKIQNTLSNIDENMEKSIKYGQGIEFIKSKFMGNNNIIYNISKQQYSKNPKNNSKIIRKFWKRNNI